MNLTTLAVAMRAANVADFYMTKYQSKAQEKLGPIMQPFISGMRRIEEEEMKQTRSQNGEPRDATEHPARGAALVEMARRRIRRFVFSANRTMWFSPCELALFIMTGSSVVKTERNAKTFSGKGMAMMHECKRLLNRSTAADGLLFPRARASGAADVALHMLVVPRHAAARCGPTLRPGT